MPCPGMSWHRQMHLMGLDLGSAGGLESGNPGSCSLPAGSLSLCLAKCPRFPPPCQKYPGIASRRASPACCVPSRRRLNKDKQHRLHLRLTCTTLSCCDSDVVLRRLVQSGAAPGSGRHCCVVAVETLTLSLFATPHIQCCLLYITPLSYLGLGLGSYTICPISPINPS